MSIVKFSTGVPGLDKILGGGLIEHGLYLLEGSAGAGKTILGNQICFHRAKVHRQKTLFVSLMSESVGKMLHYLRPLEFFDDQIITQDLCYASGYSAMANDGIEGLKKWLFEVVKSQKTKFLVIDGFRSAKEFAVSEGEYSRFLFYLNSFAGVSGCTIILIAPKEELKSGIEDALVDGMIQLNVGTTGLREYRYVVLTKNRGTKSLAGRHYYKITESGFIIYPRIEALIDKCSEPKAHTEQLAFDIPKFDKMLIGGVTTGSVTNILGAPGAGKTLLSLKFLEAGLKRGENCLYFGFYESPDRLLLKAEGVGINLRPYIESGHFHVRWFPAVDQMIDEMAQIIYETVNDKKISRLVIDGVDGFRACAVETNRTQAFFIALTTYLRCIGVTTFLTEETNLFGSEVLRTNTNLSATVENIFLLRYVEVDAQLLRLISIFKLRDSGYDSSISELSITSKGIDVKKSFVNVEHVLSGSGKDRPEKESK